MKDLTIIALLGCVKYAGVGFFVIKITISKNHHWLVKFSCILLLLAFTLLGLSNTIEYAGAASNWSLADIGKLTEALAIMLVLFCLSKPRLRE